VSSLPRAHARKSSAPPATPSSAPSEWLELAHKLTSALSGQADRLADQAPDPELQDILAKVQLGPPPSPPTSHLLVRARRSVRTEESREAGPVHVGYQFWLGLGLDGILAQAGLGERYDNWPAP